MKKYAKIILIFVAITMNLELEAQEFLSIEKLKPFCYSFDIVDDTLQGNGAGFLIEEMSKAQFTMLGEYHGSLRISEFTKSIIPILDSVGYKTLMLEVGPFSGQILNSYQLDAVGELESLNHKFSVRYNNGERDTPIPFFSYVEDAAFLQESKKNQWNVFGVDQEYDFGFKMLMDLMYHNLEDYKKAELQDLHLKTLTVMDSLMTEDINDGENLTSSIFKSTILNDFLSEMEIVPENKEIIQAIKKSVEIYETGAWFDKNAARIQYMKKLFKEYATENDFNIYKDKLLAKMGAIHLSKGFSSLGLFEMGNTLTELAEFNGNTVLNIAFSMRYYLDGNELKDICLSENKYHQKLKILNQMGQKDKWTIIDLRPLRKILVHYKTADKIKTDVAKMIQRYDLFIIPKTEIEPSPNY